MSSKQHSARAPLAAILVTALLGVTAVALLRVSPPDAGLILICAIGGVLSGLLRPRESSEWWAHVPSTIALSAPVGFAGATDFGLNAGYFLQLAQAATVALFSSAAVTGLSLWARRAR